MRGDFDLERLRRQEEKLEAEDRYMDGGDIRHLTAEEINRLADEEGWPARKRAAYLGREILHQALATPGEQVGAGSILLGGGGPILVGAGIPLPTFLELPRPWWCRPGASGSG